MNHTHGNWPTDICNQYEAEGQPCSGWRLLEAEVERLRADAERFRWLAAQTRMQIVTDGTVWHHGGGRESFVGWGYMFVNGRGYPAAPSLAELVDLARSDQGDRGTQLTAGENR